MPEQYGLNVIQELKERYKVPIGFSDHSAAETCRSNGFGSQYFESMLF
jgi:N-acetylneuraminate synthase